MKSVVNVLEKLLIEPPHRAFSWSLLMEPHLRKRIPCSQLVASLLAASHLSPLRLDIRKSGEVDERSALAMEKRLMTLCRRLSARRRGLRKCMLFFVGVSMIPLTLSFTKADISELSCDERSEEH